MPEPHASSSPDVRGLLQRLGRLKARIRALLATAAASRLVIAALGIVLCSFLADWLLDLPLAVRRFVRLGLLDTPREMGYAVWLPALLISAFLAIALTRSRRPGAPLFAFLAGGAVGLLAWTGVRALAPLAISFSPQDLALGVESRHRHLRDRLAGALDFDEQLRSPSRGESQAMMQAVVREAVQETRSISFARAASARRTLEWASAAGGAVLVCALVWAALPSEVGLWARRSILLEQVSWPRKTTLLAVEVIGEVESPKDAEQPYFVALGRSLTVYARAEGKVPDEAWLLDLVKDQAPLPRRMYAVAGKPGLFAFEFRDVRRPFAFALHGGDDEDGEPVYRVEITIPPAVINVTASVRYPEYLGLAAREIQGGNLVVPEGAAVTVRFEVNEPIAQAEVALGEVTLPVASTDGERGQAFAFGFDARQSLHYRLMLRTPSGKANDPAADTFEVRVQPDQPPSVDWIHPRTSVDRTTQGRVPLLLSARDDHGVTEVALDVRIGSSSPTRHTLGPYLAGAEPDAGGVAGAALDRALGGAEVRAYLPLDLAQLRDAEGRPPGEDMQVAVRAVAHDARGQVRESDWIPIDVRAPARVERALADRRADLRAVLEGVRREQRQRRSELADLGRESIGRAELDLLKTIRYAQGKIAQDSDRSVRDLLEVFNGFVLNRITAQAPTAHVLAIIDRHHRATYGHSQSPATDGNREAWIGDPVFPYALYDDLVLAWRNKVFYDTMLLDRMLRLLADGVDLAARLAPAAQELAAPATTGEPDAMRALLAAQDEVLASLDRVLGAMQGWQNLHDLTMTLRTLIDAQEALYPQAPPAGADDARTPR